MKMNRRSISISFIVWLFCSTAWLRHDIHHLVTEYTSHGFLQHALDLANGLWEVGIGDIGSWLQPTVELVEVIDMLGVRALICLPSR